MTLYDDARCKFVLLTMALSLGGSVVCAVIHGGWVSAMVLNVVVDAVILSYIVRKRDAVLLRLFIMGTIAGIIEVVVADPYFVGNGTLVYPRQGPFIIDSPLYMPLGWMYVMLQIGYIAWWVMAQRGMLVAIVVSMVFGGINIPTYEALARSAGWWHYQNVPMIVGAPYYVILGEAFIGLGLPFFVKPVETRSAIWSVWMGLALGFWTEVSGYLAFRLVG
ncbi:MAG TPA: hypothetical protein VM032_06070 [Vicinamibacterales bacterium]|nr:hypothetical protein [Vicinamibacterales bacterium]